MMKGTPRVVLDTNILVAASRSKRGASFEVLSGIGTGLFEIAVSVPLVLEYEDVLLRNRRETGLERQDVENLLDYICRVALRQSIFYLWRPVLRDSRDDMVLEVAVAAGADAIVTFNRRDFAASETFGVEVISPRELLQRIGGSK